MRACVHTPFDWANHVQELVVHVACGFWHAACIVQLPAAEQSHGVMCWGNGFNGQLGMGWQCRSLLYPTLMTTLLQLRISPRVLSCGSHHCALVDSEGELYTWGNNQHRCLGRPTADNCDFLPGRVECFNTVVDSSPRGRVADVACGKYFTVVVTMPCEEDILVRAAKLHALEAMDEVPEDLHALAGGRSEEAKVGLADQESLPAGAENAVGGDDASMSMGDDQFDTAPPEVLSTLNKAVSFKSEWDASESDEEGPEADSSDIGALIPGGGATK